MSALRRQALTKLGEDRRLADITRLDLTTILGADVSGYVIANWTCTAPAELPWFDGLRTPSNRPTLALTTSGNRWADMPGWDGNCADKANADADVEALVVDSSIRNVLGLPEGRRALIVFLYDNLRARLN